MTRQQAEGLIRDWACFQCGNSEARIGPHQISAPSGSSSTHDMAFLYEYQFVQRAIETFCQKAYDRSMLMAILVSWYYYGVPMQSQVVKRDCQVTAIECFIGYMLSLVYAKPKEFIAEMS